MSSEYVDQTFLVSRLVHCAMPGQKAVKGKMDF
jgi:hypothetical protein